MDKITNCDQCFNFCSIEEVKCEKGRKLREWIQQKEEKNKELTLKES